MEGTRGLPKTTAENVWKAQKVLEDAGVVFIDQNGGGPGVRLKEPVIFIDDDDEGPGVRLRRRRD
jgi:hypothetical protein